MLHSLATRKYYGFKANDVTHSRSIATHIAIANYTNCNKMQCMMCIIITGVKSMTTTSADDKEKANKYVAS